MVRIAKIQTEVFLEKNITLAGIHDFFSVNPNSIIAVYDENANLEACISSSDMEGKCCDSVDSLLKTVCAEKMVLDETIFGEAKKNFSLQDVQYIPVVDINDKIIGYCFEQGDYRYDQVIGFLDALMQKDYPVNILEYLYNRPDAICIYGLNEISFLLYQVLKKNRSNYLLIGELWRYVCQENEFWRICDDNFENENVCRIFAEERGEIVEILRMDDKIPNVGENFRTIIDAAIALGKQQLEKTLLQLDDDINICFCNIPIQMPFWTKWSQNFCSIKDVHNKIQGYEEYENQEEIKSVEAIYEMSKLPVEQRLTEEAIVSIEKGFVGKTYLKERKRNRLYVIGPCIISGYCVSDYQTVSNQLQKYVLDEDYEVIRLAVSKVNWFLMDNLKRLAINSKDILLFISERDSFPKTTNKNIFKLETDVCYEKMHRSEPLFSDCPIHLNGKGHAILAKYIYENYLRHEIFMNKKKTDYCIQSEKKVLNEKIIREINDYVMSYRRENVTDAGAIVMNCNPFTIGHQYLIEYAAARVHYLYVFVVEEDKSYFSFEDRYRMVKLGTAHMDNVIVVPSGKFILSCNTLPSYFEKEEKREVKIDASNDLELFVKYIAPGFDIKCRFVGEEPIDMVTRQYNEQMKQMLPHYGISLIEVPRIRDDGGVISASRVRTAIEQKRLVEMRPLVPENVWKYLECWNQNK